MSTTTTTMTTTTTTTIGSKIPTVIWLVFLSIFLLVFNLRFERSVSELVFDPIENRMIPVIEPIEEAEKGFWEPSFAAGEGKTKSEAKIGEEQQQRQQQQRHGAKKKNALFAYDRKRWYAATNNGTRIAVMAGPHKSGSSSIQQLAYQVAGWSVKMKPETVSKNFRRPHPVIDWAFPMGDATEIPYYAGFRFAKSHAPLGTFVAQEPDNPSLNAFFRGKPPITVDAEARSSVVDYYRRLLRHPWERGKKIIIATEQLDAMAPWPSASDLGEESYVLPRADKIVDRLLDLLPWDDGSSSNSNDDENNSARPEPLQLQDIEVQLSLRRPGYDHLASIWHQAGGSMSLRDFLVEKAARMNMIDSLGMALQYVRRGIRTTIIDTNGVREREAWLANDDDDDDASDNASPPNGKGTKKRSWTVGGLHGVVACEILEMGRESGGGGGLCDDRSRLHLPFPPNIPESSNARSDAGDRDLTDGQIRRIERFLSVYDCGVWQHLRRYQERGLFRILYPSKGLFDRCEPGMNNRNVSLPDTMMQVKRICSEDNGIAGPKQ